MEYFREASWEEALEVAANGLGSGARQVWQRRHRWFWFR